MMSYSEMPLKKKIVLSILLGAVTLVAIVAVSVFVARTKGSVPP